MCCVSAIYDYMQKDDRIQWSQETMQRYLQLIEAAREFDAAAGQPNCEDVSKEKAPWALATDPLSPTKE